MENITSRPEDQGSFHLLSDPVYGPNSKYFWPGSRWDARSYIASPIRIPSYVSGEDFIEIYEDEFSGVEDYVESTDYRDKSYCDTLRDHFRKLYNDVESWDACALFVSAVYRGLFHEMFPYESQILEFKTDLAYVGYVEPHLKEGKSEEEAMRAAYGECFEEIEKGERELSFITCGRLMKLILASNTDLLFVSELVKVLQRTNIATRNQKRLKEGLLFMLTDTRALALLTDERRQDSDREKLVLGLSLLQIEPKAAERAVDESFSAARYEPITRLIQDHPSKKDFAGNEASAYYLGPSYTARDYICDLVLSEEAYDRIFEEVRNSAAQLRVTSVLMSFEEEGTKLAELAFSNMIRELFQKNTDQQDTPLLSIVNPAAKSLDEEDLLFSEGRPLKKILDKSDERIDVPWQARKRILDICKRHGIPDNKVLAEKMLSAASLTRGKGSTLVDAFAALLIAAVASILPLKSQVMVVGPVDSRTGMYTTETEGCRTASQSLGQFNRSQPQTKPALRQATVASAQKKVFDCKNPTLLTTREDREKYDDIYIRGYYDETEKEFSMEGSCGPIFRLEQLREGLLSTVAKNMGCTVAPVDMDHFLPTRGRQGLGQNFERKADLNTAEAINPKIHKVVSKYGEAIYFIPKGQVNISSKFIRAGARPLVVLKFRI